jgi:hypothetical protein
VIGRWRIFAAVVLLGQGVRLSASNTGWHWLGYALLAAYVGLTYAEIERAQYPGGKTCGRSGRQPMTMTLRYPRPVTEHRGTAIALGEWISRFLDDVRAGLLNFFRP